MEKPSEPITPAIGITGPTNPVGKPPGAPSAGVHGIGNIPTAATGEQPTKSSDDEDAFADVFDHAPPISAAASGDSDVVAPDEYAAQVAAFSEKSAQVDPVLLRKLSSLGAPSIIHQIGIRHPLYGGIISQMFPSLAGCTVSSAKSALSFFLTTLQGCDKSTILGPASADPALATAPLEALVAARAMAGHGNVAVAVPSTLGAYMLNALQPYAIKRYLENGQIFVQVVGQNDHIRILSADRYSDSNVQVALTAMEALGLPIACVPVVVERVLKFAATHMPFVIENGKEGGAVVRVSRAEKTFKSTFVPISPPGLYTSQGFLNAEVTGAINALFQAIGKRPIAAGSRFPLLRLAAHVHFNFLVPDCVKAWKIVAPFVQQYEKVEEDKLKSILDRVSVGPIAILDPQYKNALVDPTKALLHLYMSRSVRPKQSLDYNCDGNTFNAPVHEPKIGMATKTKANLKAAGINTLQGKRVVLFGVAKGHDLGVFSGAAEVKCYDLLPKAAYGHSIHHLDATADDAVVKLADAMKGFDVVYSDMCVASSGEAVSKFEEVAEKCSAAKNTKLIANFLKAVELVQPAFVVFKTFLNWEKLSTTALPPWMVNFACRYAYKFVKTGKLHSDEFYVVGSTGKWNANFNTPQYYAGNVFRMSSASFYGNMWANHALTTGSLKCFIHADAFRGSQDLAESDLAFTKSLGGKAFSMGEEGASFYAGGLAADFGTEL